LRRVPTRCIRVAVVLIARDTRHHVSSKTLITCSVTLLSA